MSERVDVNKEMIRKVRGRNACFFFFNDTATTEIYTLSLHDALPIWRGFEVRLLKVQKKLNLSYF